MERGGREEEAGSPPGEHDKPCQLLKHNMDGKTLSLSTGYQAHNQSFVNSFQTSPHSHLTAS